jgi:rRNA-processing protein FCF1
MAKIKVLLDTNFLLTMVRQKIHGLEEIKGKIPAEFYTLSRVIFEIKGLAKEDKKIANEWRVVEQVLKNNNVKIIDSEQMDVDSELVKLSKDYVIATNDKLLRQKVKAAGGKTIFIRSLTYIDTEEIVGE